MQPSTKFPNQHHLKTCEKLRAALPPYEQLMHDLAKNGSTWWTSWREKTFGPSKTPESLQQYAARVYSSSNPADLALLVSAYGRTVEKRSSQCLKAVERLMICRDEYASTLKGLECIVLQAKCHLDFAQPRRAWLMYRRGIALAQLTVSISCLMRPLKTFLG
jgi:hypothetical protein